MKTIWGIDLGGTKIEGIVLETDAAKQKVLARIRIPTQLEKGYEQVLLNIEKLVNELISQTGKLPEAIGFGTPGTYDSLNTMIKNSNSVCLNGKSLKTDLEQILKAPVILENDANCLAMAETHLGIVPDIAPEAKVVFGIIMGTGVGGGIVVNGKPLHGHHGIGGEWGHNFLDESGGPCYCGKTGCVETVISGTGLEGYYKSITGIQKSLIQIYQESVNSEEAAVETINRLHLYFGKALASVINIIDPDIIIIGGGVGNIDSLYTEGVKEISRYVFNHEFKTPVVKPKLGDSGGVYGAAALVL